MKEIELINWIITLTQQHNIHAFYVSTIWKHTRKEVLEEQNYECQRCKANGEYSEAATVHHIKHLRQYPQLALTKSNLMSVCKKCHNELHPEKNRNHKPKVLLNEERW
ncbi:hypothetical protein CLROS_028890 [Clostridium felsineum]|uniref:Putative HNH nuclease YajD n=1 Tax=Clostridium felsineum TaxID=36839 RepID=A0A1S8LYL7_9CLOT|nr:hypothetical protein CLROS_028890 [Clostridium felsineum]URZ12581.1 hypothetical protein CROST_033040 [Clostridium felsineum]